MQAKADQTKNGFDLVREGEKARNHRIRTFLESMKNGNYSGVGLSIDGKELPMLYPDRNYLVTGMIHQT